MSNPYTSDNYNIRVRAFNAGNSALVSSSTVDVWNPAGTKVVTAAVATVAGNEISYQVTVGTLATAGTYTYEVHVTFQEGLGILTYK